MTLLQDSALVRSRRRRPGAAGVRLGRRLDPEPPRDERVRPRDRGQHQRPDSRLVGHGGALRRRRDDRNRRVDRALQPDLVSGAPRVRDAGADASPAIIARCSGRSSSSRRCSTHLIWLQWYGLFSILIPVYVSIFLAIRTALAGDTDRFLERTATTQWGLMICVYFVSYVPALLMLRIPGLRSGRRRS